MSAELEKLSASGAWASAASASYHVMVRTLDRIAVAASIGDEEGER